MITEDKAHIATEKYSNTFKSKSSFNVINEKTVVRINTDITDEKIIFIIKLTNKFFVLLEVILGIIKPPE